MTHEITLHSLSRPLAVGALLLASCASSGNYGRSGPLYELAVDDAYAATLAAVPPDALADLRVGVGPFRHGFVSDGEVYGSYVDYSPEVVAALQGHGIGRVAPTSDPSDSSYDYVVLLGLEASEHGQGIARPTVNVLRDGVSVFSGSPGFYTSAAAAEGRSEAFAVVGPEPRDASDLQSLAESLAVYVATRLVELEGPFVGPNVASSDASAPAWPEHSVTP